MAEDPKKKLSFFEKAKAYTVGAITPWKEPSFVKYNNCKKSNNSGSYCRSENGKIIQQNDQMINFKRKNKAPGNNIRNYESRKKRYHRAKNFNAKTGILRYTKKNGKVEPIPVNLTTIKFYTAKAPRFKTKQAVYMSNKRRLENKVKQASTAGFDFNIYQERLKDPKTSNEAAQELRLLKQMLLDARMLSREDLEKKYKTAKTIQIGTAVLAGALGAGVGISNAVSFGLGKAGSVATATSLSSNQGIRVTSNLASAGLGLGEKAAMLALLTGMAASLATPAGAITVTALVVSVVSLGATAYSQRLEGQKMSVEMKGEDIIRTIDQLIENHGVLVLEENPLFAKARLVKAKLDAAMAQPNFKMETFVATLPEEEKQNAINLFTQMKENAILPKIVPRTAFQSPHNTPTFNS